MNGTAFTSALSAVNLPAGATNGAEAPLHILVLDDLEADRARLRRLCRKAGLEFVLHEVSDLAGMRDLLDRQEIDIAFLDYHLEMHTGLDALKLLIGHEDQVNAIPIMITSVDRHDIAVEAMRKGCADYLTKEELSVDALRKSVTSAFERRLLIAALGEAQSSRSEMHLSILRFARTCGPQIREVLGSTLMQVRALKRAQATDAQVRETLMVLEQSCGDIFAFLDDVQSLMDDQTRRRAEQVLAAPVVHDT
ncbi:Response regulator receiver domain-containing protein [Roseivivax lentus]|uniref:Response regulator receiver domain-containing protein n=1 Tax=Roseivivax lentus TaxID=633194 RepID=A0A1N7LQM3_9RHOB|nr:response regulator [Roseivivax lentus]SIS76140.1 Response regulator receiver domain-containing protein [Roseivivax lentus]